jgi:hypothetical protein
VQSACESAGPAIDAGRCSGPRWRGRRPAALGCVWRRTSLWLLRNTGRMKWVALTDPDSARTYLSGVGLPAEPPPIAPPRPPPQQHIEFGD